MYLGEAISMSDRIVVLTKRPAKIKKIYNIIFKNKSNPTNNRAAEEFITYYNCIWKDLDIHV